MKKKNILVTILMVSALSVSIPMTALACPYCNTTCVRELESDLHNGINRIQDNRTISHAEAVFINFKKTIIQNGIKTYPEEETKQALFFDGNPINLPYYPVGSSRYADERMCGYTYSISGLDFHSTVDLDSGTYLRFDGQTYRFDKSLYADVYYYGFNEPCPNVQSFIYGDLRFGDWIMINNQHLPQEVLDKLTVALQCRNQYMDIRTTTGAKWNDPQVMQLMEQMYENEEIALEMLYGLYPVQNAQ